ncbi:MAG: hypothetical protein K2X08_03395, partial [Chlamydiales bacterium]|nr:hypothetical protein [Chlamydiales bacterium]
GDNIQKEKLNTPSSNQREFIRENAVIHEERRGSKEKPKTDNYVFSALKRVRNLNPFSEKKGTGWVREHMDEFSDDNFRVFST